MVTPYYERDGIVIYHADARDVVPSLDLAAFGCLIVDPPYDDPDTFGWAAETLPMSESQLVFTDPRHIGDVVSYYGPPIWVFTWDTMSAWTVGPGRPLTQTKFCCWYGDLGRYDRDAVLWGVPPPPRDHPTTKQVPLEGRRLTDLWRESLRWLHHPGAGGRGSGRASRMRSRAGEEVLRHAKPPGWVRCLIGNTSSGPIFDPFVGSGTTLRAAKDLGRPAVGIDIDEQCCEFAARRLDQNVLPLFDEAS